MAGDLQSQLDDLVGLNSYLCDMLIEETKDEKAVRLVTSLRQVFVFFCIFVRGTWDPPFVFACSKETRGGRRERLENA